MSLDYGTLSGANDHPSAPWQKLPMELWSVVFVHCLPPDPSCYGFLHTNPWRDSRLTPMTLASVCQAWRNLACSTSELWSTCWVNYLHPELNTIWLGRAGARTLYLYGGTYQRVTVRSQIKWDRFFGSILPFQRRWKSLMLDFGPSEDLHEDQPFTPQLDQDPGIYALETLIMPHTLPVWIVKILPSCPRLRKLDLSDLGLGTESCISDLHLPFLSELKLLHSWPPEVLLVLHKFPQLQSFVSRLGREIELHDVDLAPVRHTNLLDLRLNGSINRIDMDISNLLGCLTLPSLRTFRVSCPVQSSAVLRFIQRSGCCITHFSMVHYKGGSENKMAILQDNTLNRWVEKLDMLAHRSFHATLNLSDFLSKDHFPHLTQLSVRGYDFRPFPEGAVADMIIPRTRWRICKCEDCLLLPQTRAIRLERVSISLLDRAKHCLDAARLVPLPDDRVRNWVDADRFIDLQFNRSDSRVHFAIAKASFQHGKGLLVVDDVL